MPDGADRLRRRPGHDGRQWRPGRRSRASRSTSIAPTAEWTTALLRRRRRAADRAAAGPARPSHRARRDRRRARRDRGDPARRPLPGRAARRRGARLCLRELRRAVPPARPRPDRRQRPRQPARLPDPAGRLTRTATGAFELVQKFLGALWVDRRSTTRRSTSSPGTAISRPTNTTCAASTRSARSASTIPIRRSSPC